MLVVPCLREKLSQLNCLIAINKCLRQVARANATYFLISTHQLCGSFLYGSILGAAGTHLLAESSQGRKIDNRRHANLLFRPTADDDELCLFSAHAANKAEKYSLQAPSFALANALIPSNVFQQL